MRLSHLIPAISRTIEVQQTLDTITSGEPLQILDVPSPARPALIAAIVQRQVRPMLIVSSREDRAIELYSTVREFLPDNVAIELWPAPEGVPYDRLPRDAGVSGSRVSILADIAAHATEPVVVFTSVSGLAHHVFRPETLSDRTLSLSTGQRV